MKRRPGVTRKVSLSIHKDDLRFLQMLARNEHDGNLSAVFAELIAHLRRQQAMDDFLRSYGKPIVMTPEEERAIDTEILGYDPGPAPTPARTRARMPARKARPKPKATTARKRRAA
jgi:hypothetical protein